MGAIDIKCYCDDLEANVDFWKNEMPATTAWLARALIREVRKYVDDRLAETAPDPHHNAEKHDAEQAGIVAATLWNAYMCGMQDACEHIRNFINNTPN